jgi:hypothetical protein
VSGYSRVFASAYPICILFLLLMTIFILRDLFCLEKLLKLLYKMKYFHVSCFHLRHIEILRPPPTTNTLKFLNYMILLQLIMFKCDISLFYLQQFILQNFFSPTRSLFTLQHVFFIIFTVQEASYVMLLLHLIISL